MIMSKIITMNEEEALIIMKARGAEWTVEVFDDQKCLEHHQVKSIEDAVKRAFTYMFEPIALTRQTVCYDAVAFHDKDCNYVFDFKLHNVTVHLK